MDLLKTQIPCLAVLLLMILFSSSMSEAKEIVVGGNKHSWQVPSSPDLYSKWAQSKRFQIGDTIVVKYDGKIDSILEVSEESYKSCNKTNPIQSHNDGNTKITLDRSGLFYFISGAEGHCEKGQKLEIRVQSEKPHHHESPVAPVPSPADNHHYAPAPAPKKSGCASLKAAALLVVAAVMGTMCFV